jgi:hypothetical protein
MQEPTDSRCIPEPGAWFAAGAFRHLVASTLLLGLSLSGPPARAWTLENDRLAVQLSPQTGAIVSVLRKDSGERYDNPAERPFPWRVIIPLPYWEGHEATPGSASRPRLVRRTGTAVSIRTAALATGEGRFAVQAELDYRLEHDNVVARLRLLNRSQYAVQRVLFPILETSPAADSGETLEFPSGSVRLEDLFSANTVRHHHDPFPALDPQDLRAWFYSDPGIPAKAFRYPFSSAPGAPGLPTAWMLYRGDAGGIGWDVRDRAFQTQKAVIERKLVRDAVAPQASRRTYELSWHWHPWLQPGESWESPDVHLKFDDGDWRAIAAQHRDWLSTWIERPQVPLKFQTSLGWLSRGLSSFDAIPALAREGVDLGIPYLLLYGWFSGNMHTLSYAYHPRTELGGEESLRRNLAAARALGAHPLAWFNGTTSVESMREHHEFGRNWIVVDFLGGMDLDGRWTLYGPDRPPTVDDNSVNFNFDMGAGAADYLVGIVRRLIEDYGFSGFEMDQGAKNFLSYSTHGTAAPPERRYTLGMQKFYEQAARLAAAGDPEGVILGENAGDFVAQYVHSSWHFEGGALDVAGLDRMRFSLPWLVVPVRAMVGDRGHANLAFILNAPLDIFEDTGAFPEYAAHLRALAALKREVHPYLYDGDFSESHGFSIHGPDAVAARSYRRAGAFTAVTIANTSDQPQQAIVEFEEAPVRTGIRRHRLREATEDLPDAGTLALELEPFDVQVIVLRHGEAREP